ncbi:coxsackievirus and adenovirus receptor-like [Carassius auratus]|uniref:Coxsackievirus and adenovirus receptor-like n=1 Tax=Carassius auratus TaxID=7957 RepID=A0A6P6Q5R4_CARAU|nr:coxsackievirus and adenovirus receptor-like [Carassius auratus]
MKVTSSGPQTLQMAQGDPVTLDCTYTSSQADIGDCDGIELIVNAKIVSPLFVAVRPSVPTFWVDGGEAASLRCRSDERTVPLLYSWRRESGGSIPPDAFQSKGELLISNHSVSHSGVYSCAVSIAVGKESCRLHLQSLMPPKRAGVITGTIVGCLLIIMIPLIIIWLIILKCNWNQHEKEFSNEIREDAPAPSGIQPTGIKMFCLVIM